MIKKACIDKEIKIDGFKIYVLNYKFNELYSYTTICKLCSFYGKCNNIISPSKDYVTLWGLCFSYGFTALVTLDYNNDKEGDTIYENLIEC